MHLLEHCEEYAALSLLSGFEENKNRYILSRED